jgi:hypothetical protein
MRKMIIAIVAPMSRRSPGEGGSVANHPFFKNTKITKRTQFKNCTTRHPRQLRRTA